MNGFCSDEDFALISYFKKQRGQTFVGLTKNVIYNKVPYLIKLNIIFFYN